MTVKTPLSDASYYHGASAKGTTTSEAAPAQSAPQAQPEQALGDLSWKDLRSLAKQVGVTDYAKMKRPALEAATRAAQKAAGVGE